ncbi:MAG: NAD-dependent epimerase/dehydratase family protein [Methanomicrobiales archaeon]|nr:NAD-dependent epimerase/dehydratase family protein [Methanomicrobiales archaeon]
MERLAGWEGRRVLVTGATGVVGLNLVNTLVTAGSEVTALVRDWVPRARHLGAWLESGTVGIVRGELEDYCLLERTLAEYEIEYVFHLGAQTIVPVGNRSPVSTFRANIEGTWNLLEACRVLGMYDTTLRAICVASSDKAYGSSPVLPYTEDMPLAGEHPYDVSKSCTDLIAQSYGRTYDLPVGIARMGNIYGPGDLNFNRIVPGTIRSIIEGRAPAIRSDGTPVREYFYVGDAVLAYLTLAEKTERQSLRGEAFNFSSGEKRSVSEVVGEIIRLMGADMVPEILNTGRHEIQDQYLAIEKARRVLGWEPAVGLSDGMQRTIAWYREVLS